MCNTVKVLLVFGLFSFQSCIGQSKIDSKSYNLMLKALLSHSVEQVDVATAQKKQEEGSVFLDARERKEYEVSHIENAIHVGYDSLDLTEIMSISRSTPIIVYCSVGYRSEKVGEQLKEEGFENISNLYGGIFEWKNQGYEVVNELGKTEKVHAYDKVWGIWLKKGEKIY